MAEPRLSENYETLEVADAAAGAARRTWLEQAKNGKQRGKQIPPKTKPDGAPWSILLWLAGRGFGKLLDLNTPLPTPSGWTTMGKVSAGDWLLDENGKPCRVVQVHPVDLSPESYRVAFSDGTAIDAGADHLWVTWTHRDRKQYQRHQQRGDFPDDWATYRISLVNSFYQTVGTCGPGVRSTSDIRRTLTHGARADLNHCIPVARSLDLPPAELPVDPYVLGYWLGNGTASTGDVTTGSYDGDFDDAEIAAWFQAVGYAAEWRQYTDRGSSWMRVAGLRAALAAMGLLNAKRIPASYLRASAAQRLALLQGLCDSDGHVGVDTSYIEFSSVDAGLAASTLELVRSLGERPTLNEGRAMLNGVDYGPKYRVTWRWSYGPKPFRLRRKAERLHPLGAQGLRMRHRMIVAVDPIPPVPMRCITVDSPNGLYLAGEGMIPTHNTKAETEWLWWECWQSPGIIGHYLGPTHSDVAGTLFLGPAGLRACIPAECLYGGSWEHAYRASPLKVVRLANGSIIRGFATTEAGNRLRGPQCHRLAGDELAYWDHPRGNLEVAFNNAMYGLRMRDPQGRPARGVFGTTPKSIPFLRSGIAKRRDALVVNGSSYENIDNLDEVYRNQLLATEGTQLGKQEIYGQFLDEEEGAIIQRNWFRLWPTEKKLPEFSFILASFDTAYSEEDYDKKTNSTDPSGCTIWGIFNTGQCFKPDELKKLGVRGRYAALLCDCWAEWLGFPELLERARKQHLQRWGQSPGRKADVVLIEAKASGVSLRQSLLTYGVPAWPYNPGQQSKTMRMHAAAPFVKQGCFFVPESGREDRKGQPRDWVEPFLEQVCAFKGEGSVAHDEFVDTLSQSALYFAQNAMLSITPEQLPDPDPEERKASLEREAQQQHEKDRNATRGNPYF